MQPPVEHARPGTAADAALLLAILAVVPGAAAAALALFWLVGSGAAPWDPIVIAAAPIAVVSWIFAVAAAWTGAAVRRRDRGDRRARLALLMSAPGAAAGTVAVLGVVLWIASWRLA